MVAAGGGRGRQTAMQPLAKLMAHRSRGEVRHSRRLQ